MNGTLTEELFDTTIIGNPATQTVDNSNPRDTTEHFCSLLSLWLSKIKTLALSVSSFKWKLKFTGIVLLKLVGITIYST